MDNRKKLIEEFWLAFLFLINNQSSKSVVVFSTTNDKRMNENNKIVTVPVQIIDFVITSRISRTEKNNVSKIRASEAKNNPFSCLPALYFSAAH